MIYSRQGTYKSISEFYNTNSAVPESHMVNDPYVSQVATVATPKPLTATWQHSNTANTNMSDPSVWGSAFWFSLHNGASKYPVHASGIWVERMKGFILGIPYILPCDNCSEHARAYIDHHYSNLNEICSGRSRLFAFFVDMHNMVNKRLGKPYMSVEDAYKLYSGVGKVERFTYK
jgi:hypothetical protein